MMKLIDKTKELDCLIKLKFYRIHELTKILNHNYSQSLITELQDLVVDTENFLNSIHKIMTNIGPLLDNAHKEVEIIYKNMDQNNGTR
jgi:hypothetical protein